MSSPARPSSLISETRGTRSTPVATNASGDFVFPAVAAWHVHHRSDDAGLQDPQDAAASWSAPATAFVVGTLTIDVGGTTEVVNVTGEAPLIQAQSGERSFTIPTDQVANLPIANRSFTALTQLAPGVQGNNRIGGGGGNNIMIDGVSAVDTGSNAILLQMNVESIAEVKVLTSGLPGRVRPVERSAGHGGDQERHEPVPRVASTTSSATRTGTRTARSNILNGDAKAVSKRARLRLLDRRPGRQARWRQQAVLLLQPGVRAAHAGWRTSTASACRSALERAGDFSQTLDNNGDAVHRRSRIRSSPGRAARRTRRPASGTAACSEDSRRAASTRWATTILNLYPLPNIAQPTGQSYNYEDTSRPRRLTGQQPAVRVDYQPSSSLRVTGKYSGWRRRNKTFLGTMPGITESVQYKPVVFTMAFTVNYTINPTTFLEATYGHSQNDLSGLRAGAGRHRAHLLHERVPVGRQSNKFTAGLGGLPVLFPNAFNLNKDYYAYKVLEAVQPAMWQNGQLQKLPTFTFGGRVTGAPPNVPFSGFLNKNATDDISFSITKVAGRHTFKGGFYNTHSWKAQQQNSGATFGNYTFTNNTDQPARHGFPYANALLGIVSSYNHASTYIEGTYVYDNTEAYIQDNWKLNNRFTLDYGVRFVRQQPQYDKLGQASNFFPNEWTAGAAPLLYGAGCTTGVTLHGQQPSGASTR